MSSISISMRRSAPRIGPRLATADVTAEERLEEVADPEVAEALTRTEHVVALAPLGVGEHLVGLGDLFEALARVRTLLTSGWYCRASFR